MIRIFEDLGLLVRGEIIWKKGEGMNSSTAWGSWQKPSNPVLRDLTERIVVASKGRFDRALSSRKRAELGLPCKGSIFKEEFMSATKDVWEIPSESATRVGHPAPFPVALPKRLIDFYTYYDDLVLDPYMGSGTTGVAAVRQGRQYVGCETDAGYIEVAEGRVADERARLRQHKERRDRFKVSIPAIRGDDRDKSDDHQARAVREGQKAEHIARVVLEECGFSGVSTKKKKLKCGVVVDLVAQDQNGELWHFDVTGAFTSERDGLRRTDTLWKSLGKAAARQTDPEAVGVRYVFLTTSLPESGAGLTALRACQQGGETSIVFDAVEMLEADGQQRLRTYAADGRDAEPPDSIGAPGPDALF